MCRGENASSRQELAWVSRRAGRHKVETSSDLAAIKSLVICSCLPTRTALILGAVRSMGQGPGSLWSEVDPSDYASGNCAFSFLWHPLPPPPVFFPEKWDLEDADGALLRWLYAFPPLWPVVWSAKQPSGTSSWLNFGSISIFVKSKKNKKKNTKPLSSTPIGSTCSSICFSCSVGLQKNPCHSSINHSYRFKL